ncbi:MAG: family 43 glycosylhydrolase [Candidatus Marinimicrobia bacterium]|nr:family 43 glycosylhydrolase [Candidatus Neomarinimicrobiota bacterium]
MSEVNRRLSIILIFLTLFITGIDARSPSFETFVNPVIPGDHPDPTLTKIGNYFYTSGSSFNPTPIIYRSTDLVHWEAIARPVSASWSEYGDEPGLGIWGGHIVYYNGYYWHFFCRQGRGFFYVKAEKPEGPWSKPVQVNCPPGVPGLGYDNSIFIDDNGKWYLLVKNGQVNNWIVELGPDGQPKGSILDLTWLNPAPNYPYSWAEGPVMWKYNGYYYYSFALNLAGGQKTMRSPTLTDDSISWEMLGDFFKDKGSNPALFSGPNHASPVVTLNDGTHWVMYHAYNTSNSSEWYGHGRQGLLSQVRYDEEGRPVADYPINAPLPAPNLPSSGIPWMVPKSDFFESDELNPEWSILGYTEANKISLQERAGWLRLYPKSLTKATTVIKNDGERNYSLMTRIDFNPMTSDDEAGLWIINGPETKYVKLCVSENDQNKDVIRFSFEYNNTKYEVIKEKTGPVWLKLYRDNHIVTAYYSYDTINWTEVGEPIDITVLDRGEPENSFNKFTGNRQGLFVIGRNSADFDCYIYRDAYSPILAEAPANWYGIKREAVGGKYVLSGIEIGDWALYAGVEFGGRQEYPKKPLAVEVEASSATSGGTIEMWLDSIDTGNKIAEVTVENTGDWTTFKKFRTNINSDISGRHDLYLRFTGGKDELLKLKSIVFISDSSVAIDEQSSSHVPDGFSLYQNYPNPFNSSTTIEFSLPVSGYVEISIYDIAGKEIYKTEKKHLNHGLYRVIWPDGRYKEILSSGIYFYRLRVYRDNNNLIFSDVRKMAYIE